jgi:hypothetical protein
MHALNWGASEGDMTRVMAGDAVVPHPNYENTMAVEIGAQPHHIWPWLAQLGYHRGGLYSYDWLDRLFGYLDRPSATRVLPEFQQLREGDVIPLGRGAGLPVIMIDADRALVLGGQERDFHWIWEFGLYPIGPTRTRLVSRSRAHVPSGWRWRVYKALLAPAAFLMTRRMLLGLQRRAEGLAKAAN